MILCIECGWEYLGYYDPYYMCKNCRNKERNDLGIEPEDFYIWENEVEDDWRVD